MVPLYFQVEGRDEEVERLNRMLDGGRPSDVVALEARNRANERMISHLNIQVRPHQYFCLLNVQGRIGLGLCINIRAQLFKAL